MCKLEWSADEALPYTYDWPKGVPQNYDVLAREYKDFVANRLRRHNRVKRNFEDLLQEVWTKLVASRVLDMFVLPAARKLPESMTVAEAIAFLGIDETKWFQLIRESKLRVKLLKGNNLCDLKAAISTHDVFRLDKACAKVGIEQGRKVRPALTSRGFRAYLERAIHNAYANFCRTRSRRYKEQLLGPQVVLSRQSTGVYRQVTELEDGGAWEANLATAIVLDEESTIDVIRAVRKSGAEAAIRATLQDPNGRVPCHAQDGVALADMLGRQESHPERSVEVLELVRQGKSLTEAVKTTVKRERFRIRMRTV